MRLRKLSVLLSLLFVSVCLSACQQNESGTSKLEEYLETKLNSSETLEEFFNQPLNKFIFDQMVEASKKQYGDDLNNVEMTVEGNRIIVKMYLKGDASGMESYLKKELNKTKDEYFEGIRQSVDLDARYEVEYIFYNSDYSKGPDIVLYEDREGYDTPLDEDELLAQYQATADSVEVEKHFTTIEEYYEDNFGTGYWEEQAQMIVDSSDGVFTDCQIKCMENYVSFSFHFAEDMGDVQANVEENLNADEQKYIIDGIKNPTGIQDNITVGYYYYNPDGTQAAGIEFEG